MNGKQKLIIEVLNGPLDGTVVALEKETEWTKAGQGPLSFPWDEELGEPQAHLQLDETGWTLAPRQAAHGTYRVNTQNKVTSPVQLQNGDILKASNTWLLVQSVD